jgi:hypothetical protein
MAIRPPSILVLGLLVALVSGTPARAQIEIAEYWISADTNVRVPRSDAPGTILADDRSTIILFPDGTGQAQALNVIFDLHGSDVDAFDWLFRRVSLDTARIINGVLVEPGDVFYLSSGTPVIDFDADAAGVPDGVNLDAVTLDPDTGQLKVSFDRFFEHPSVSFVLPGDLITVVGGQLDSVAINGVGLGDGVNLDAAHQLDTNNYLISVDVDAVLPGGPGTFTVRDDDVILYSIVGPRGVLDTFEPLFSLSEQSDPSWEAADLDALWAELAPQGGEIRLVDSFFEVQESAGTLAVRVERVNGSEGPVGIFIDAVSGTASEDADFTGDVAYTLLWDDGESGVRTITPIDIIDDGIEEGLEDFTFEVSILSGTATVTTPAQGTVRILDNDGDFLFSDGFEDRG